jgi:putative ABC transport system ATP-binding protein
LDLDLARTSPAGSPPACGGQADAPPALSLAAVSKAYGTGPARVPVLHDISLSAPAGDFLAIVGPSGSGKSTLLNLIGLLDSPDSGEIRLDGLPVAFQSPAEAARLRNRMIGFVFQSFQLLPRLTAWENVALPLLYRGAPRAERRRRALAALEDLGLADRVDHRPSALSGGQCQRVALARALVGEPRLILADEPTGSLDTATGATVMDMLRDLNARLGTTVVMVTHDPNLAARCASQIEIRDGRIQARRGAVA